MSELSKRLLNTKAARSGPLAPLLKEAAEAIDFLHKRRGELVIERDAALADARRYRWLRDNVRVMEMCFNTNHPARWHLYGEQMDAELDRVCAIEDAALRAHDGSGS